MKMTHSPERLEPGIVRQILALRLSKYFAALVLAIGILVLGGWSWDISPLKRPVPHFAAMNPLTALSFVFSSISFFLLSGISPNPSVTPPSPKKRMNLGRILACLVLSAAMLRISGALGLIHLNIDHLLFTEKLAADAANNMSSQMTVSTASCLILS